MEMEHSLKNVDSTSGLGYWYAMFAIG
jgi:hypothetical protein